MMTRQIIGIIPRNHCTPFRGTHNHSTQAQGRGYDSWMDHDEVHYHLSTALNDIRALNIQVNNRIL